MPRDGHQLVAQSNRRMMVLCSLCFVGLEAIYLRPDIPD